MLQTLVSSGKHLYGGLFVFGHGPILRTGVSGDSWPLVEKRIEAERLRPQETVYCSQSLRTKIGGHGLTMTLLRCLLPIVSTAW